MNEWIEEQIAAEARDCYRLKQLAKNLQNAIPVLESEAAKSCTANILKLVSDAAILAGEAAKSFEQ